MTLCDSYTAFGFQPEFDISELNVTEVHISVAFTWDIDRAKEMASAWSQYYPTRLGGPALCSPCEEFVPDLYIRSGVTFTSRGCNNKCPPCLVPKWEGRLKLLDDVYPAPVIQDNNILQTGRFHMTKVFQMLRRINKAATFSGGLQASLVDDWVAEELRGIKIKSIFLAADNNASLKPLKKAVKKLSFLPRDKLRCYVLLAFNGESIKIGEERLEQVWEIGCLPFAQLYQPPEKWIDYSEEWKNLAWKWCRPAATKAIHRSGS